MSTSIQARQSRGLGFDSFADITDVPLVDFDCGGLLFDGDLTDMEIGAVWWFATSRDDADEAARRNIAALRAADTTASPLVLALAAYVLGET